MLTILRHALSILLLPFLAAAVIPWLLLTFVGASDHQWSDAVIAWLPRTIGVVLFLAGFLLFSWCLSLFYRIGKGTLAPWDPTQNLVAVGPYRFVRNPMITGVASMLVGEALFWGSSRIGFWASLFVAINHVYFVVAEEPGLEKRFGEGYRIYKSKVPRWLPRLRSSRES